MSRKAALTVNRYATKRKRLVVNPYMPAHRPIEDATVIGSELATKRSRLA